MFNTSHRSPLFPARGRGRALETWREAAAAEMAALSPSSLAA